MHAPLSSRARADVAEQLAGLIVLAALGLFFAVIGLAVGAIAMTKAGAAAENNRAASAECQSEPVKADA